MRGLGWLSLAIGLLLVDCGWREPHDVCWSSRDCPVCSVCVNGSCVANGACDSSIRADAARPDVGPLGGDSGVTSILGDYFTCKAPDCAVLDNDGLRLKQDRTAVALLAPGELLEPGEAYCEVATEVGSYGWDGQNLVVEMTTGTLKGTVDAKTGVATITWMSLPGGGNVLTKPVYMKRVPPRSTGACK
jgi:hypothetical protein